MDYFFMFIEKPAALIDDAMQVESEDFLYHNLHESDPFGHGLDYYGSVLRHFQIDVPYSMLIEVQLDRERHTGNRVAHHQSDGSFTDETL